MDITVRDDGLHPALLLLTNALIYLAILRLDIDCALIVLHISSPSPVEFIIIGLRARSELTKDSEK